MQVNLSQISPNNFRIGNILEDVRPLSTSRGEQFYVEDVEDGIVSLGRLGKDERVKSGFIQGQIR
jgi:hypothetical protein